MNLCILGSGLTSLTLAKTLVNQGIQVDLFQSKHMLKKDKNRTLGISKINLDFFNKEISNIEKLSWEIKQIEITSERLKDEKILNFENKGQKLFSIVKNDELINHLLSKLRKEKLCKFRKDKIDINLLSKKYGLIINCDYFNSITKKFFFNKIKKNYDSFAYSSIIKHSKIKNYKASQIFTSRGPLAFLPISEYETSVVYSVKGFKDINFKNLIRKYNLTYKIKNISDPSKFELNSLNLRKYYYENVLAFGDLLHKIHPLAGQGYNMTLRDIKEILILIKSKKENGLDLDKSICMDFEKKTKNRNFLFSNSIDFIYEFFNLENKLNNNILSKTVKIFGKNKNLNKFFTKIADNGLIF